MPPAFWMPLNPSRRLWSTLRESLDKAKDSVAKTEREAQAATHKKDSAGQRLERLGKEADGYRDQQEQSLVRLRKEIQAFGVEALSIDTLEAVLEQLTVRRDQWVSDNKKKTELEQKIIALDIQTRQRADQIQKSENELQKQQGTARWSPS